MVEKNKDYILDIVSLGYEGEGIAKVDGFPIFIKGALEGEKVKVKIVRVNKNFAFGKLIEIIEKSEHRKDPVCSIYNRCGGCSLQHSSYEKQLDFKTKRVEDCLVKIGKLKDVKVNPTLGMENPYRYRNKVQLPVGENNKEINIGFYAPRSHDIIDMKTCHIQHEEADKVGEFIRYWMKNNNIKAYDEKEHLEKKHKADLKNRVRHIMVRKGYKTGEVMVVIVTASRELKGKEELVSLLKENIKGLKSVIQNVNPKNTNVVLGEECITLWGSDTIKDYIGEFHFNISPLSFFQVNPDQTEVLYGKALEYAELTGEETVFDAYCGTGTISLFLSKKAKKVYGVEIVAPAIENAKINAKENGVENAEFIVGEAEKVIPDLIKDGIYADVVVVDPPRKGCGVELLEAIGKMGPKRIVYVSCDPGTLGRDLGILKEMGYEVKEVHPVDMFPHTSHVETVVKIVKK